MTDLDVFITHRESLRNNSVTITLSVVWKIPYFGRPKYPILQCQNTLYCTTNIGCFAFAFYSSLFLLQQLLAKTILPQTGISHGNFILNNGE